MTGLSQANPNPFAAFTPTNSDPANPGPFVTAIQSISLWVSPDSYKDSLIVGIIVKKCSLDAISGMIPPYFSCICT